MNKISSETRKLKVKTKTTKKKKAIPNLLAPPKFDSELTSSTEDLPSLWDDVGHKSEELSINSDIADDQLLSSFYGYNYNALMDRCLMELEAAEIPPQLKRQLYTVKENNTDQLPLRVLQWNSLAQVLAENQGCECPPEALNWAHRKFQIIQEIVQYNPDIVCLQEVDHFKFIEAALGSIGYVGRFLAKPKSLCLQLKGNNGPDGCALFYKTSRLEQLTAKTRVLEAWGVQSNQVCIAFDLRDALTGLELCVATTHLKARKGPRYEKLREKQGKDLLEWMTGVAGSRPAILTGDFNAAPDEPVYKKIIENDLGLKSAYCQDKEPSYTAWQSNYYHTIDYIFHSTHGEVIQLLDFPSPEQIGPHHLPTFSYPSDHFSLVADILF